MAPERLVRVAVSGAASPLGERVVRRLGETGAEVALLDLDELTVAGHLAAIADVDVVVDLGSSDYDARAAQRESTTWFTAASLAAADASRAPTTSCSCRRRWSTGRSPNNPVPLTEEAVLRPDVEFVFARQLASAEELVEQWRLAEPGRSTTVLRPVIAVAADGSSRLATAYVSGLGRRLAEDDPPSQFLHLDDLASAITAAIAPAPRRRVQRRPRRLGAGRARAGAVRRAPASPAARAGGGARQPAALAVPARSDPARSALVHARAVGGRQRPAAQQRMGSRRSPTSRPTSRAPSRSGGR